MTLASHLLNFLQYHLTTSELRQSPFFVASSWGLSTNETCCIIPFYLKVDFRINSVHLFHNSDCARVPSISSTTEEKNEKTQNLAGRLEMNRLFHDTFHPEIYHGRNSHSPFFEGWYFKIVDADSDSAWAIIPGIYKGKENGRDEAFIMTLDGRTHKSTYHSFPIDSFQADERIFDIRIGEKNRFWSDGLALDLPELSGSLSFSGVVSWPVSFISPGIMGPFAYFPLECYHGVLSLDHGIQGQLQTPSGPINFEGGRGYIEKDWGRNFPQTWIWFQANDFKGSVGTSISVSIARIPFYGFVFPGFIIGFWHKGVLHRFTTYVGARLKTVAVDDEKVTLVVKSLTHRLVATATRAPTALLHMPTTDEGMVPRVAESVGATVSVQLFGYKDDLLFEGHSRHGGLEVHGDVSMLLHG